MVCFGNNDFAVIAGYGDVVIGSMTIKKVYYVEELGHNLFSVGQFCDKGLEFAFRKSTCFVRNEDGVDLLTDVIFSMIMRMLESSRLKVILECLLDIQKNLLSSEFTTNELIMKSSTSNVETSINEEVFHEVSDSFREESYSSSLNDDVQQSPEEVVLPQTNTQSISNNMVPNGDEASTSLI
nr:integrase, catalytic region, zinc finger, CCHC-type, peptidase aspartic, catalytic [Tanacetum cinerariifolium]